jgi:hypothetical protein
LLKAILPRIGQADGLAVFNDVGQGHHFGQAGFLVGTRHVDFQRAEVRGEVAHLTWRERLPGIAQHAVAAQCCNQQQAVGRRHRLRQVQSQDARAQTVCVGFDVKTHERLRFGGDVQ